MENAITSLRIQNFKSIKDVTLKPRRVNLIIGQPNVGKSNVLEALSLLGAGLYDRGDKFMGDVLRYETVSNLFYDNDTSRTIVVESNTGRVVLRNLEGSSEYYLVSVSMGLLDRIMELFKKRFPDVDFSLNENFDKMQSRMAVADTLTQQLINEFKDRSYYISQLRGSDAGIVTGKPEAEISNVNLLPKKYKFGVGQSHTANYLYSFLEPPLGSNLWEVVQRHPELRKYVASLFKPYGLKLVLRVGERKFEIQKEEGDFVYNYPYSLIADTLQRIIFYTAAIESNKDSVLLFEEPEAHSYPAYVAGLARRMVDCASNQFFVATHSPYLFTEVIEQMLPYDDKAGELGIFVAYYEDYQTKIHQLSDEQMLSIRRDSLDVFLNMRRFIPRPADA